MTDIRVCAVTNCDINDVVGMELITGDQTTIVLLCIDHGVQFDESRRGSIDRPPGDDHGTG